MFGDQRPASAPGKVGKGNKGNGRRSNTQEKQEPPKGRERTTDVEALEEQYYNSRKEYMRLEMQYHASHQEVSELEKIEYRKDKLLLEMLMSSKVPVAWSHELDSLRNDLETLAEGRRKAAELRGLVEERDEAIGSIVKQLKQSRAAQLEEEVAKMQQLVKTTKQHYEQFCDESHLHQTRQLHLQVHKVWQEIHGLQTNLTKLFTKQNKIQEATEVKQLQMKENKKQIEILESKMREIQEKEKLAEQRLEEQLRDVEENVAAAEELAQEKYEALQTRKHAEQRELKKLEQPKVCDKDYYYITTKAMQSDTLFKNGHPEIKSALLGLKNASTGPLATVETVELDEVNVDTVIDECLGPNARKEMTSRRFLQLLYPVADTFFSEQDNLKALDLEIALHNFHTDDVVKPEALKEASKAIRQRCIEKRISEKAVKEVFFRSTPTQIGSFMLKIDIDPIYIDTVLHVLKTVGCGKAPFNLGAAKICGYIDGWQTSTVQDDIQLCDWFCQNQKRSIVANSQQEFESKLDKRELYKPHEIEHLFWLFANPQNDRVELKMPINNIKSNLLLLSQLTHHKIQALR